MPKYKENETDKLIKKQQEFTTGISCVSGIVESQELYSDEWKELQKDFNDIYNNDVIAKTTIDLVLFPIEQADYAIDYNVKSEQSKQAKDLIEYTLSTLIDGFDYFKKHILLAVRNGLQIFEIVFNPEKFNGKVINRVARLLPIKNETIYEFYYNEQMDFIGINQERIGLNGKTDYIQKFKDNLFWISHNMLYNDIRGNSELRQVRIPCKIKQKILIAGSRAIQRGSGIPIAYSTGNMKNKTSYETLLRNISNSDGAYALINTDEVNKIELLALQNQENLVPILEFLNRDIFFNTLTQFITSGLGQNGSRASTGELKSPYEMKINAILKEIESYMQWLCNIIIQNSYLANIPIEDYPKFRFEAIQQADTLRLVQTIQALSGAGLILNQKDIEYLKSVIGLPDMSRNIEIEESSQEPKKEMARKKYTDLELTVFELENANNTFLETQTDVENILNDIIHRISIDIFETLKRNGKIDVRFERELYNRLMSVYNKALEQGQNDVEKEIKKVKANYRLKKVYQLQSDSKEIKETINNFLIKIKTTIQDKRKDDFESAVDIENYINENVKESKRTVITNVQSGYTNGRGNVLENENIEVYQYSAKLDNSTCENCNNLDGTEYTKQEVIDSGLSFTSPVNPDCLGQYHIKNTCRCQLVAKKIGD